MPLEARVAHGLTESEAARLAREVYGLEASARALPGEYDENFHLIAAPGRAFVLKVMHPAREPSFIDLQSKALVHLASRAAGGVAARAAESQRRALLGNDCCGWLEAAGLAAELFERNPSCQSAPARPGAASRLGPLAWRDGRRFAVVRASRSASRAEMGFLARGLDQGVHPGDCRGRAAGAGRKVPCTLSRGSPGAHATLAAKRDLRGCQRLQRFSERPVAAAAQNRRSD